MKNFTLGLFVLLIVGMGISTLWDINTHKDHQIKKYQNDMADREEKIRGLEDSILKLKGRIEIYDATWDYLRGFDSITIDGVIYKVRKIYEYDEQYYNDVPVSIDYQLTVS